MEPGTRVAFESAIRRRRYSAEQVIYLQGDVGQEMYRLASGSVRLSVARSDGRQVAFLHFGAGDCFGEASLIDGEPRLQTAEAVTDLELEVLDAAALHRLRSHHRSFDHSLLRLLSRQMRFAAELYTDLALIDLTGRIARRILEAARPVDADGGAGGPLQLPLSQTEIASMVGASRQTVNRTLQQMQNEGVITTEYNKITAVDIARLHELASRG
jgi:CRP-like cAMP-binding protein